MQQFTHISETETVTERRKAERTAGLRYCSCERGHLLRTGIEERALSHTSIKSLYQWTPAASAMHSADSVYPNSFCSGFQYPTSHRSRHQKLWLIPVSAAGSGFPWHQGFRALFAALLPCQRRDARRAKAHQHQLQPSYRGSVPDEILNFIYIT